MINVSRFLGIFPQRDFSMELINIGISRCERGHDGLGWGGKNVPTNVLTHVIFMLSWGGAGWGVGCTLRNVRCRFLI